MIIYGGELVPSGSATVIPVTGFAITGSNQFNGSQTVTGSLLVSGSSILTGSLFVTNDVTSSQLRATTGMVAPNVTWTSTLGSNGGEIRISQTQFRGGNNITQVWSQTTDSNGTRDLGIRRNTTGSLEIYDGNTADGAIGNRRDLLVRDITGSNAAFSGNLTVNGNIIAQQYIVSSSVTYMTTSFASGSNRFGNSSDDTHIFTGSLLITGSVTAASKLEALFSNTNTLIDSSPYVRLVNTGTATLNQSVDIVMRFQDGTYNGTGGISMIRESATARNGKLVLQTIDSSGNNVSALTLASTGASTFSSSAAGYGITLNHTSENLRLKMGGIAGGIINIQGEVISSGNPYPLILNYLGGSVGIGASTSPTYKLEVSAASGSERIRVGTLQNNNNTATFEAITSAGLSTATSGWIRAVYGGGLAIGTSTYTKANGDSGNFANLSSESATVGMTVETSGTVSFSKTQKHSSNLWHVIPFGVQKGNGAGSADSRTIIEITSDTFHEYFIHINYGARLQNLADSQTYISSRMYGVNRFNSGAVAVTDSAIMAGSGGNINTHAPITAVVSTSTKVIVKVDFSTSCAAASFVWGEIRLFSWEGFTPTIVNNVW